MRKFIQGLCVCLLALGGVAITASPANADTDLGPACIRGPVNDPQAIVILDGSPEPGGEQCSEGEIEQPLP